MRVWVLVLAPLLGLLAGCPIPQSQDTPVPQKYIDARAGEHDGYWLYVPSNYTPGRAWPLVITLHGTYGFESSSAQIREWKALAQEKGFIVAAPRLRSVQGVLPVVNGRVVEPSQALAEADDVHLIPALSGG